MSNVIDDLAQEHAVVLARIAEVRDRFTDADVCARFLDFLEQDVVTHFHTEEEVLFPQLACIPSIANGPLRVMNAEHDAFRGLLQSARHARTTGADGQLAIVLTDLTMLLQRHIAKEDGVLFPMARDLLTEAPLTTSTPHGGSKPQPTNAPRRISADRARQ